MVKKLAAKKPVTKGVAKPSDGPKGQPVIPAKITTPYSKAKAEGGSANVGSGIGNV